MSLVLPIHGIPQGSDMKPAQEQEPEPEPAPPAHSRAALAANNSVSYMTQKQFDAIFGPVAKIPNDAFAIWDLD